MDDFDAEVTAEEVYEAPEYDDSFADQMELGAEDILSQYDDDPSPYDGTYSEE